MLLVEEEGPAEGACGPDGRADDVEGLGCDAAGAEGGIT